MSICFDGNRSARYDLLLVDDQDIGLSLKMGALGADKPPANNTYYFGSKLRILGKTFLHVISDFEKIKKIFRKSIRGQNLGVGGWVITNQNKDTVAKTVVRK